MIFEVLLTSIFDFQLPKIRNIHLSDTVFVWHFVRRCGSLDVGFLFGRRSASNWTYVGCGHAASAARAAMIPHGAGLPDGSQDTL